MTVENLTQTPTVHVPEAIQNPRLKVQNYVAAIALALITLVLFALTRYGNFQSEGFTLLSQLRGPKQTIGDTLGFFFSDWGLTGRYYAPLPRLAFYFEYKFFQTNPAGWHWVSALLHTGAAVLVWRLVWQITRRPAVAALAGLFFALLPGHVQVVADAVAQAEILVTIFCLASAISFVVARQTNRIGWAYWLSVVFYGLALLCKQEALVLPLALLGYDFITGGFDRILHQETEVEEENDQRSNSLLSYYLPFLALVVVYLVLSIAFFGGLSVFTTNQNPTTPNPATLFAGQDSGDEQSSGLGNFLRGNLRYLAEPFGLGGTDGLILLAALLAFLALTGIQEWEAWQIFNPQAARARSAPAKTAPQADDDDEMDLPPNPLDTLQNGAARPETPVEAAHEILPAEPLEGPAPVETQADNPHPPVKVSPVAQPNYWTLRLIGYAFLWTAVFLIPFALTQADYRTLYPASVGFAFFLATVLFPYGLNLNWPAAEKTQVRALFGPSELSFWLRMIAIVAVVAVYFATTVNKIDEWNAASKVFTSAIRVYLGL